MIATRRFVVFYGSKFYCRGLMQTGVITKRSCVCYLSGSIPPALFEGCFDGSAVGRKVALPFRQCIPEQDPERGAFFPDDFYFSFELFDQEANYIQPQ